MTRPARLRPCWPGIIAWVLILAALLLLALAGGAPVDGVDLLGACLGIGGLALWVGVVTRRDP